MRDIRVLRALLLATKVVCPCADPESLFRGGPTSTMFFIYFLLVDEGRDDPKTTKIEPSSFHQRNAIQMAFQWWADDGPSMNAG